MQRARIFRLESYLDHLTELKTAGRNTVTSEELASRVGISSSRVRQDLIYLQVEGKPRAGYEIDELEMLLYSELDLLREKGMILIGCGNLGRALIHSGIWEHSGFQLKALFDSQANVVGKIVNDLTIRHVRELHAVIRSESIVAACLTVPAVAAQDVANMLVGAGVKGIWNFAPVTLRTPAGVIVENQRLEQGLMTLSFAMKEARAVPIRSEPEKHLNDASSP